MADSQMSQICTLFRKISLFDATIFDMAPRAHSDDYSAFLDSAQDAGVRCIYIVFSHQSSIGTCQNFKLVGCDAIPRKLAERMHWRCLSHYVCML